MTEIHISMEKVIGAPPDLVYDCLADYANHHPKILPANFSDFRVESGGRGAGTVMTFKTKTMGRTRSWRGTATEPEPGRVLVETYTDGTVTSFFVDPAQGGSLVRIETHWTKGGLPGLFEKLMAPPLLKSAYSKELANLEAYARSRMSAET
jgi:hypothetical protein